MPIRIKSDEINKNIDKFTKLFYYLKQQKIQYELIIETIDSLPQSDVEDLQDYIA